MLDYGFYNMDCMDGMKQFPDKYFDLAIVDPPYGDGGGNGQTVKDSASGLIDTDIPKVNRGGVARKTEISPRYTYNERMSDSPTEHGVTRIGGTWARKYAKKSLRGMWLRLKSILTNSSASHGIKLYGAEIILNFHRHDAFSFGEN